jgi:hypothetical protein
MARLNQNLFIPDNTKLEENLYYHESSIESVQFGQSIKISGDYIFTRCHEIKNLVIPNGTIIPMDCKI